MQIGQTIWAIDPKETSVTFGNSYEIYERRKGVAFSVINEKGVRIWFEENEFDKYFSLTPPKEKELKMELNYLKALLPVVKEDLQTSYDIVGHESTAINRFVSKVEELINSQS